MKELLRSIWNALERGHRFVTHDVWHIGKPGENIPSGLITKHVRVAILLLRGIYEETLLLRASALTFATMLFIVPFLVFMFSFIQTFHLGDGLYNWFSEKLTPRIVQVVSIIRASDEESLLEEEKEIEEASAEPAPAPEPAGAREIAEVPENTGPQMKPDPLDMAMQEYANAPPPEEERFEVSVKDPQTQVVTKQRLNDEELMRHLIKTLMPIAAEGAGDQQYYDPVNMLVSMAERGATSVQTLGVAGIFYILITVLGLMRNVEWSFNRIWGLSASRNLFRTLSDYIVITLILPFVAAGVLGVTAAIETIDIITPLSTALRAGQFAMVWFTFSLLYYVVPNTKVQGRYALLGGLVAGALWVFTAYAYVRFNIGLANYTRFFSTFALFPLFLFWIYTSWIILLFGALLTFAYQHEKTFAMERMAEGASYAYREALAVRTVIEMARRFKLGLPGLSVSEMGEMWNVPTRLVNEALSCLVASNLVTECATQPIRYQPARSPEYTKVLDVVRAMREAGRDPSLFRADEEFRPLFEGLNDYEPHYINSTITEISEELDKSKPEKRFAGEVVELEKRRAARED